MKPKRIDVERVAEAMRKGGDWFGVACELTESGPTDEDALMRAAIRLLLREQDKVIREARKQRDTYNESLAKLVGEWTFKLRDRCIATCYAVAAYDESRRSRAKRVKEESQ